MRCMSRYRVRAGAAHGAVLVAAQLLQCVANTALVRLGHARVVRHLVGG